MENADYVYTKELGDTEFDAAVEAVTEALAEQGFGVLTEIDVKSTLKKKLDADFRNYKILGACNPELAHQGLQREPNLGALLPCNVVVQEAQEGSGVQVNFLKPTSMIEMADNEQLESMAGDADERIQRVIDAL